MTDDEYLREFPQHDNHFDKIIKIRENLAALWDIPVKYVIPEVKFGTLPIGHTIDPFTMTKYYLADEWGINEEAENIQDYTPLRLTNKILEKYSC